MSKKKKKLRIKFVPLVLLIIGILIIATGVVLLIESKDDGKSPIDNIIPTTERFDKNFNYTTTIDELETYYLALNGKKTLEINFNTKEGYDNKITWTVSDENIIKMEDNVMFGVGLGTTNLTGEMNNGFKRTYKIMVTDLIIPPKVNYNKPVLPCNRYSEEEANLLDKILASRVQEGGEGARGGVLAAARFLTLEFPYKIKYFNENGRLVDNGIRPHVDAEGRYYHKGLYLHKSKFETLEKGATRRGPAIWGCNLWDEFVSRSHANGFTCSGFVTWAMYNGGFDIGDVGAGLGDNQGYKTDLWFIGPHHNITMEYMKGNTYKVGDFIARSGHAALIIGIDEKSIYTAEALPRPLHNDVSVYGYGRYDNQTKLPGHNKKGIVVDGNLTYIVEMSNIYPNGDGWTTDMWES